MRMVRMVGVRCTSMAEWQAACPAWRPQAHAAYSMHLQGRLQGHGVRRPGVRAVRRQRQL